VSLNRVDSNRALALLVMQEYGALGRLIEDTNHLNREQKIDVLSSLLQLTEAGKIHYDPDAKRVIEDIVAVLGQTIMVRVTEIA
jgi:hypothetical protein